MVYPGLFNASYAPTPLEIKFIVNPAGYLSPYLFGVIFSFLLGGLILGQATRYFSKFRQTDDLTLQLHVLLVLLLTTLKLVQVGAVGYLDFSKNYGDYLFLTHKHWTLHVSVLAATLVSAAVQVFFIKRVFLLSHRSMLVLIPTTLAWAASIGSAIWVTVVFPTEWAARSRSFVLAGRVAPACTLAADLLITGFTVWFLLRSREAFPTRAESPVGRVLRVALESAAPPLVTALANVVYDDQADGGLVFLFVAFTPLLQTMSLLYSLNSRIYFRRPATERASSAVPFASSKSPLSPRTLGGAPGSPFPFDVRSPRGLTDFPVARFPRSPSFRHSGASTIEAPLFPFRKDDLPFAKASYAHMPDVPEAPSPGSADTFVGSPAGPWKV